MLWARLLAYVTGRVNQELLLRYEYPAAENRILRGQIKGRVLVIEGEKATLAEIAHRLGRKALEDVLCQDGFRGRDQHLARAFGSEPNARNISSCFP